MATIVEIPKIKEGENDLKSELQKFALPNRDPKKATEELYGIWEGRDISLEKIRTKNRRNKWL